MALFIKFFLLTNAAGDMMTPVYIIADDNMLEEEVDMCKITGLGIGAEPGSCAWLTFCKTRCGNSQFFEWVHHTVLTEAIHLLRTMYGLGEQQAWFQLDGEPCQIACYSTTSMLEHLTKMNISVGKPP